MMKRYGLRGVTLNGSLTYLDRWVWWLSGLHIRSWKNLHRNPLLVVQRCQEGIQDLP
jgi:hypothetical protein